MDRIRVRVYNVLFGDAILVTVPDRNPETGATTLRRILIDIGNAMARKGGDNSVFKPVVEDLLFELGGAPVDLYVMTHEHLDHVQGLPYVAKKFFGEDELRVRLRVTHSWFTASADPDYRSRFAEAAAWWDEAAKIYAAIRLHIAALPEAEKEGLLALLEINNIQSTKECVDYLRGLTGGPPTYVHRESNLAGTHPFEEARLRIWAPEEDTKVYFQKLLPLDPGPDTGPGVVAASPRILPPPGVDAGAFYNLVTQRAAAVDNILRIDAAANNTSLVFSLEWRGWKLLFTGDAERESWEIMGEKEVLEPVHFLKVSHHCSANGTPEDEILDRILPLTSPDSRGRQAAISTCDDTYSGVPDETVTRKRIERRCEVRSTLDAPGELSQDFFFEG